MFFFSIKNNPLCDKFSRSTDSSKVKISKWVRKSQVKYASKQRFYLILKENEGLGKKFRSILIISHEVAEPLLGGQPLSASCFKSSLTLPQYTPFGKKIYVWFEWWVDWVDWSNLKSRLKSTWVDWSNLKKWYVCMLSRTSFKKKLVFLFVIFFHRS